jgi:hypothetical protein
MAWRQKHRYPVVLQILFAVSFILFLIYFDQVRAHRDWLWAWCIFQGAVGVGLIRGRVRARKRVLRCIRCSSTLP